ncbi:MAG TPA: peptidoglycan-binding protein [Bryobacteraceae bacterium]
MRNLSNGSRGADVMFLQCLLNKKGARPRLVEDGVFGRHTHDAVVAFQQSNRVAPPNGTVGAGTWSKFGAITERLHRVTPTSQSTDVSCWSAAATTILGDMSVGQGQAALLSDGELAAPIDNIETFVQGLGWRLINNQSVPPASTLITGLQRGPLWVAFQGRGFGHAVVFSGVYSDGANDASATVFVVNDPWPPNSAAGTEYGTTYHNGQVLIRAVSPPQSAGIAYVAQP